jgi:hypothetical protein
MDVKRFRAWLKWLRENPDKQIVGEYENSSGECCAMGALHSKTQPSPGFVSDTRSTFPSVAMLMRSLGLSSFVVMRWNDIDRLTFPEIADRLEKAAKQKGFI